MQIAYHRIFKKQFSKLRDKDQARFENKLRMFKENPSDPSLNNHALHGKYKGYRSINLTGNLRVIYKFLDKNKVLFIEIGTHSNLYS